MEYIFGICGRNRIFSGIFRVGLKKTERAGFEPAVRFYSHTRFPSVLDQPLRHLSENRSSSFGCASRIGYVKRKTKRVSQPQPFGALFMSKNYVYALLSQIGFQLRYLDDIKVKNR